MTDELGPCGRDVRSQPDGCRQILLNGFKSAFVPYRERAPCARAVLEIDQELTGFNQDSESTRLL